MLKTTSLSDKKGFIYSEQNTLFGHGDCVGFGNRDFMVKEIPRDTANGIIKAKHYSKKFYAATYIHLGVFICGEMVGVLQYGYAMNPASQGGVVSNTGIDEYLELNRMWLDDKAPRNSESKAISYSIKFIKQRHPKVKWIQSFADERCQCFRYIYFIKRNEMKNLLLPILPYPKWGEREESNEM